MTLFIDRKPLYWAANLHRGATCRHFEGPCLMEVQLYLQRILWYN